MDTQALLDKNGSPSSRRLKKHEALIRENTAWMLPTAGLAERVWNLHNGHTKYSKVCHCGSPVTWSFWSVGYANEYCSVECWQDKRREILPVKVPRRLLSKEERVERQERSNLKKYGVRWPWMAESGKRTRSQAVKRKSVQKWMTQLSARGLQPLFSVEQYVGSREYLQVQCSCGTIFDLQRYKETVTPGLCPTCYTPNASRWQHEVNDFVRSFGFETRLNDRRVLGNGYELDIWIPELRLAIECDGAWWHSEGGRPDAKEALRKKLTAVQDKNIKLISIFDFEWSEKRAIVEGRIRAALNRTGERIGARKLQLRELSRLEAVQFFETSHLQGSGVGRAFGLLRDGVVICAMSVASSRWKKKYLEIIRMATMPGVSVPGGASRLLSHVLTLYPDKPIISYADLRWGNGETYEKLGFSDAGITGVSFFYVNSKNQRASRHQMQISKLNGTGTELEQTSALGWFRVWTAGNRRWVRPSVYMSVELAK